MPLVTNNIVLLLMSGDSQTQTYYVIAPAVVFVNDSMQIVTIVSASDSKEQVDKFY